MPLQFDPSWRLSPPPDGDFLTQTIPPGAVSEFLCLVAQVATQKDRQEVLEHYKRTLCRVTGQRHYPSSNADYAEHDLRTIAEAAASKPARFIEAFFEACSSFANGDTTLFAPSVEMINEVLRNHRVGYEIRLPELVLRGSLAPLVEVPVPPTLAERARTELKRSLDRSEQLLIENRPREAVQESLWLLESVATGFSGLPTATGTVEGKYFNEIVKDLKAGHPGTTLKEVLGWAAKAHGYLSSPTGGGVRHGLDLNKGIAISPSEARLFCNLFRSYLYFFLDEHARMSK